MEKQEEKSEKEKSGFWKKYGLFINGVLVFGALAAIMIYFMVKY